MEEVLSGGTRIGILGGGQLGKMFIQAASQLDIYCAILDPNPQCPAAPLANNYVQGDFSKYEDVLKFGECADVITIEIENVNTDALKVLRDQGKRVHPSPEVIETIKDKGNQKNFYRDNNIHTSDFTIYPNGPSILEGLGQGLINYPFVQKACREGYDGRGVAVIRGENDLKKLLNTESIIEPIVDIDREVAVILSRNEKGEINVFPIVEMEFSPEANLVELLVSPARIDSEKEEKAISLGKKVVESLELIGLIAVEMFVTKSGEILVNESAPRPHNSGHHTIEANVSSQYEQHLRAITGMPLGSCNPVSPAVMINVLGSEGFSGDVVYKNAEEVLNTPGAHFHIYGKKQTKPFRKMGHITICGNDVESLIERGKQLKNLVRVEAN
ncbi:MAG TPA: 5-(carboxyamino)imidazole ribonucleotide synthase [Flavobacteriales bacterium]|nr:5-(carboxyamino)imidazole ribonucleotide synthase [Flavobacteriales bacterium]